jgi:hypothetical protein
MIAGWTEELMVVWMDEWMDGWYDGWMGVGMNGWMVSISETITAWARLEYGMCDLR